MKMLIFGLAISVGMFANDLQAQATIMVDGKEMSLETLTKNCQSLSADPQAMITCFNGISELLEQQGASTETTGLTVPEALEKLKAVAQYAGEDTGLLVVGSDCNIELIYYANYFHISRRNVSELDLYSAKFDASKLEFDQVSEVRGAQAPLLEGQLSGANAVTRGGITLDSDSNGFDSKTARQDMQEYAKQVASQLPADENARFDFVLVHPKRSNASADIWDALEIFVKTCNE